MLPASSTRVLLLRLKTFPFAARAPSQEVSGAEWSPQRHTLDRRRADWASLDCQSAAPICSVLLKRKGTSAGRIVCNNEGWNLNFAGYLLSNKNVPKAQWISGVPDRRFFRVGLCNTHTCLVSYLFCLTNYPSRANTTEAGRECDWSSSISTSAAFLPQGGRSGK